MLSATHVSFQVRGQQLLTEASVECRPGELTVLMGPNGAGKTTLLRLLAGLHAPSHGQVQLDGQPLSRFSTADLAKRRAVLSQETQLAFPLSVAEVVLMGRYPHFSHAPTAKDRHIAETALNALGMTPFATRDYLSLSGGEAQKVQMARVLAQLWEPPTAGNRVLLLDEPVSSLDLSYQHELLRLAQQLARQQTIVVAILHDVNLALAYADRLVFLKNGHVHRTFADPLTLDEATVQEVFGLPVRLISNPFTGKPLVVHAP